MRNFTKPRLLALASCIVLLILISGCGDSSDYSSCEGAVVACFYHDDDPDYEGFIGEFCIENDIRPCQCFTDPKEGKQENRLPEFKNPEVDCDDGPAKGIGEEPYEMKFPNKSDLIYIEDEASIYFDKSSIGSDRYNRPLYVSFVIKKFDLEKNDYTISVSSDGILLDEEVISADISHESPKLRFFSGPNFCGDTPCKVTGTVKFDISDAPTTSFYGELKLIEQNKDPNSTISTEIAFNQYPFIYSDFERNASTRLLNIVNVISDKYNVFDYQTLDGVSYPNALEQVFGEGKSNISTSYRSKFANEHDRILYDGDLIMLDINDVGTDNNYTRAIREWGIEAYSQSFPIINVDPKGTGVMAVEAYYYGLFDIQGAQVEPLYDTKKEHYDALRALANPHGVTWPGAEYIFSLVFRNNDSDFGNSPLSELNSIALATHFHELGHALSKKGYYSMGASECEQHTYFCSGFNKDMCLWRTPCFSSGGKRRTYMKERAKKPTFCERHQQIFMNNFSLRQEN